MFETQMATVYNVMLHCLGSLDQILVLNPPRGYGCLGFYVLPKSPLIESCMQKIFCCFSSLSLTGAVPPAKVSSHCLWEKRGGSSSDVAKISTASRMQEPAADSAQRQHIAGQTSFGQSIQARCCSSKISEQTKSCTRWRPCLPDMGMP